MCGFRGFLHHRGVTRAQKHTAAHKAVLIVLMQNKVLIAVTTVSAGYWCVHDKAVVKFQAASVSPSHKQTHTMGRGTERQGGIYGWADINCFCLWDTSVWYQYNPYEKKTKSASDLNKTTLSDYSKCINWIWWCVCGGHKHIGWWNDESHCFLLQYRDSFSWCRPNKLRMLVQMSLTVRSLFKSLLCYVLR